MATEPYFAAVRTAANRDAPVRVRPADEAGDLEVLVSGRPEPGDYAVTDAVVDGLAALSTADGTWWSVLDPAAVRDR